MDFATLFIDKGGMRKNIPGFSESFSFAELGFWGEYSFFDFALYNIRTESKYIVCEKELRKNINSILQKWDEKTADYILYSSDFDSVNEFINKIEEDILIIYTINFAAVTKENSIINEVENYLKSNEKGIEKISVDSIPVDVYITDRQYLLKQIESMKNRIPAGTAVFDYITDEILETGFDRIADIDGEILFNSSAGQFFENNISLISEKKSAFMESFLRLTPPPVEKESFIGKKGEVLNSIISSNSRIDGYVENSVIFSNVTVKRNAEVINSVIMSGNQIGKNVTIENTLILPNYKQTGSNSNIQDKSVIGGKSRKLSNSDYPEQINNGITVLGMNSSIPVKFSAESGSLIGADIPAARLKEIGKIKKSGSVL